MVIIKYLTRRVTMTALKHTQDLFFFENQTEPDAWCLRRPTFSILLTPVYLLLSVDVKLLILFQIVVSTLVLFIIVKKIQKFKLIKNLYFCFFS